MLREPTLPPRDPVDLGIAALEYLGAEPTMLGRFLDITGLTIPQLREQAKRPSFFVGLFDFMLAHEPTLVAFAAHAKVDPMEVHTARERLLQSRPGS